MGWLEWLDEDSREKLRYELDENLSGELADKGWGFCRAREDGGPNEYVITDLRGLNLASGLVRNSLKAAAVRVIYRGQDRDYPLIPSLYRRCSSPQEAAVLEKRLDLVLDIIADVFYPSGSAEERELVCQHYGMPTRFLDVADNIQTALWFAYDRTTAKKGPECPEDDMGCFNILALPDDPAQLQIFDLRAQPSAFLRIHTQQAFAIKKTVPGRDMGLFTDIIAAKFMLPRKLLRVWSNHDNIPYEYMFPPKEMDEGLSHWEAAVKKLRENNIEIDKYLSFAKG